MSPCPLCGSRIGAYHDDELPEEQCRQLALRLVHCERCRAELDRLQRISRRFRESVEPPRRANDRVDSICDLNIPRNALIVRTVRGWALAAMVVILAGVTWCVATGSASPVGPANWERLAVLHEASTGAASGVAPGAAPGPEAELQFAMLLLDETFDGEETGHN